MEPMNYRPSECSLYMRFDTYCKKNMKFKNYKLYMEEQRYKDERRRLQTMVKGVRKQDFWVYDTYPCSKFRISVESIKVIIENEILYQALDMLSGKRLEIILLSYFVELTDKEIGKIMSIPKSSVQYNRNVALQQMRKMMEEYTKE